MDFEDVDKTISKLYDIALHGFTTKKLNACLSAINASADIQYQWNQKYIDEKLENLVLRIAKTVFDEERRSLKSYSGKDDTILFYDSFGLDTRGLALIYTKALCDLGYHLIYVIPESARNNQPEIHKYTSHGNVTFCYLSNKTGIFKVREILQIFKRYQPAHAFFYTTPNDSEACIAFSCMAGYVSRYQINLTDHAFWLGVNAFDYCLEFREYGACVSKKYRHIPVEKIRVLPFYPFIDKSIPFAGFDFDTKGKRILFSGGGLYKTINAENTYYRMVAEVLKRHPDILFLYAGSGDDSELKKLAIDFPERVIHIKERKDLYALLCHTTLYLNTYPMIGGLMSQYAAMAGKPPMTLVDMVDSSLDGLILNHKELPLEFSHPKELLIQIDTLLDHDDQLLSLGKKVKSSVLSERDFQKGLSNFIKTKSTGFSFEFHDINTDAFRRPYMERFTKSTLESTLCNRRTIYIWKYFPNAFVHRVMKKLSQKILRRHT